MELNFGLTSIETMYNDAIFRIDFVAHFVSVCIASNTINAVSAEVLLIIVH